MTLENPEKLPTLRRRDTESETRRSEKAKRREAMLDGLASGLTHTDVAAAFKVSPRTLRREVAKCLDERRAVTAEEHARMQSERLNKALRAISEALDNGDLKAARPLLQVLERIDYYQNFAGRLGLPPAPTPVPARLPAPSPALPNAAGLGADLVQDEPARTDFVCVKH